MNSKSSLIRRLRKGKNARNKFVESHLNKKLAFQIRALRGDLSQEQMEAKVGIKQQALSRLENPYYGKATLTTLKKIAAGCDVGLLVEFIPFSQLVNRVSGTAYVDRGFSPETMNVPSFEEEERNLASDSELRDLARHIRVAARDTDNVVSIDAYKPSEADSDVKLDNLLIQGVAENTTPSSLPKNKTLQGEQFPLLLPTMTNEQEQIYATR